MKRPNILMILMDDLGQRDLGCYGSEFYETPNIDEFSKESMMFTDAYAACPVCSPSRASIMSGKYPARVGVTDFLVSNAKGRLIDAPYTHQLPLEEFSLGSALREGGYATWHVGKWHLGTSPYYPEKHGFDVNIGGCEYGLPKNGYFSPYNIPNLVNGEDGEYLTDRLTREAVKLIEQHDGKNPFFLNLWHYAVHVPIQASDEKIIEKYKQKAMAMGLDKKKTFEEGDFFPCEHKKDKLIVRRLIQSDPNYAGMIENMDDNFGVIIDTLKKKGIYDNTIIIFTSDNGGLATAEGSPTCNLPLSDGKGWMYDGGVRVPLIIRYNNIIKEDCRCNECMSFPDFYPTLLELCGLPFRPEQHIDGKSLVPALKGDKFDRGPIFWHYPHYGNQGGTPCCAIREKKYKLIYFFEDENTELYNLDEDPSELNDLSGELPLIVLELKRKLNIWLNDVEAQIPLKNPDFVSWKKGYGSKEDVQMPFDMIKYDADVYYGKNMDNFH